MKKEGAGILDRRITIEVKTLTIDSFGQEIETWRTFATVWASLGKQAGRETFEADQKVATNEATFTIRYQAGILETMRISFEGEFYDITSIEEITRFRWLMLKAKKKDSQDA